jgi:hypothetical protein
VRRAATIAEEMELRTSFCTHRVCPKRLEIARARESR